MRALVRALYMANTHEYVKELERQIRNYELMVENNIRIIESVCGP